MKQVFNILLLLIVISCNNDRAKKSKQNDSSTFLNTAVLRDLSRDTTDNQREYSYKMVYYFDGGCSACIAKFVRFVKKWNLLETKAACYFVAHSSDKITLEYYLEQAGLKLQNRQEILIDEDLEFVKQNKFLNASENILLVDRNDSIISVMNPFLDDRTMDLYQKTIL